MFEQQEQWKKGDLSDFLKIVIEKVVGAVVAGISVSMLTKGSCFRC